MKMTTKERLETGCGFQDNDLKSSLCIKRNLCSECKNNLDYYNEGRKDAIDGVLKDIDNDLIIWKNSPCVCCKNWRDTIIRFRNKQKDKITKEMQE